MRFGIRLKMADNHDDFRMFSSAIGKLAVAYVHHDITRRLASLEIKIICAAVRPSVSLKLISSSKN